MAMRTLDQLGPLYLKDPGVAHELLAALKDLEGQSMEEDWAAEHIINQAWLDCHWDNPECRKVLVEISDCFGRQPEPMADFLEVCWANDFEDWHHFIELEMVDDARLATKIYQRFDHEGPTVDVLESMMFLRDNVASDIYADPIIAGMINSGMRYVTSNALIVLLLKLWRRYGPVGGINNNALKVLKTRLVGETSHDAIRVVECIRMREVRPMMDEIAVMATKPVGQASRRARRIMLDLSDGRYAKNIAHAARKAPWHSYLTRINHRALIYMLEFMRDNRSIVPMVGLFNAYPRNAMVHGAFTHIMECDPDWNERSIIDAEFQGDAFPTSVHSAVYHMYMWGEPPPAIQFFHYALRDYPRAVENIAKRAHLVKREVTWARRKLLLCCMAKASGALEESRACKYGKVAAAPECMLARYPEAWPVVMGFLG